MLEPLEGQVHLSKQSLHLKLIDQRKERLPGVSGLKDLVTETNYFKIFALADFVLSFCSYIGREEAFLLGQLCRFPNFALPKLDTAGRKEPFLSAAAVESGVNPLVNSGAGDFQLLGGFAFCKMLVDGCAAI